MKLFQQCYFAEKEIFAKTTKTNAVGNPRLLAAIRSYTAFGAMSNFWLYSTFGATATLERIIFLSKGNV